MTLQAATVWDGEKFGPPLDHLALLVACGNRAESWLVDVGFGAHSLYPLTVSPGIDQDEPGGTFRIDLAPGGDLDVLRDGILQYRVEPHPRVLSDFHGMCWYHQTSPRSHFTTAPVCTLQTDDGRVTLSHNRLIHTAGTSRVETKLDNDSAILRAYCTVFDLHLDRVPHAPSDSQTA